MSNSFAIQNLDGDHIGFVLTHFESDVSSPGRYQGECVFIALPMKVELLNHPLTDRMYQHKFAGEHSCKLSVSEVEEEYSIAKDGVKPLRMVMGQDDGQIFDAVSNSAIGKVVRAKT
jgi:hypothetical protein